ncbi:hypothetical protein ABZ916_39300 [Streptomyces sp. NPDC046853]|uniref:DUF6197 family protein n=1 Tax=Streptomyces sp. NPDC046853 TaxID=3154920 RepID=UPI0033FB7EDC
MTTATPTPYSPVAEAERTARLSAAYRLVGAPHYWFTRVSLDTDSMFAARQLQAASELLVREGWAQGAMRTESGWCLYGALDRVAVPGAPLAGSIGTALRVLDLLVDVRTGMRGAAFPKFNDAPGRTVADMLELLADGVVFACTWEAA